jgi:formamidopyrimidine-DNA glycosylase
MPELPDVQVFRSYIDATCLNQRIDDVHLRDADRILDVSAGTLRRHLRGGTFRSTRRHGKHLFVAVDDNGWLRLHFGMTGFIEYFKASPEKVPDHTRLLVDFEGGYRMVFANQRKLGAVDWTEDADAWIEEEGLGPDAMEVGRDELAEMLEGGGGSLKGTLMNQELIAGLGTVYTDEILFQVGLHPKRTAGEVDDDTVTDLHRVMGEVLRASVDARVEDFPSDFLIPRREEGAECPRCGGTIEKTRVSGRPTYFCPDHQDGGG